MNDSYLGGNFLKRIWSIFQRLLCNDNSIQTFLGYHIGWVNFSSILCCQGFHLGFWSLLLVYYNFKICPPCSFIPSCALIWYMRRTKLTWIFVFPSLRRVWSGSTRHIWPRWVQFFSQLWPSFKQYWPQIFWNSRSLGFIASEYWSYLRWLLHTKAG